MKAFTYERVNTPAEAALSAQRVPGAKFIAGGTNLLDLMKLEIETPTHLIDVNGLGLDKIEVTDAGGLRIGALVRNTDLAAHERVRRDYAVLSRALLAGGSILGKVRHSNFPFFCRLRDGYTAQCWFSFFKCISFLCIFLFQIKFSKAIFFEGLQAELSALDSTGADLVDFATTSVHELFCSNDTGLTWTSMVSQYLLNSTLPPFFYAETSENPELGSCVTSL